MRSRKNSRRFRRNTIAPQMAFESLETRCLLAAVPQLIKDINTTPSSSDASFTDFDGFVEVGSSAFFLADNGKNGTDQLWKSDGTTSGTVQLTGFDTNSTLYDFSSPVNVNGILFFHARNNAFGDNAELWKSDGTAAGTTLVRDINPGLSSSSPEGLINVNGTLFFTANDGSGGVELWKSDGTQAGTVRVKDIRAGFGDSNPVGLVNVNGTLFFSANDGSGGKELWKSDGTANGTVIVKDILPGSGSSGPVELTNVNGTLFFAANNGTSGIELWKSNGTAAGTVLVKDIGPGDSDPNTLTSVNGTLFFVRLEGNELWKSDGTEAGTVRLTATGVSSIQYLTNVNGTLFFSANDATHGNELWKSNGTPSGTVLVKDLVPGQFGPFFFSSFDRRNTFANVNGTLFFYAQNSFSENGSGEELWKSDGSSTGTVLVKDINPGAGDSNFASSAHLANVNGTLFFRANDGERGVELWKSNGTAAGTVLVKDINQSTESSRNVFDIVNLNGTVYFSADDGIHGQELWKTDGTGCGSVLVRDISLPQFTGDSASSSPLNLTNVGGTLYFTAFDRFNGTELWKTDGTAGGTVMVKDIRTGRDSSSPNSLVNLNGTLIFTANDGTNGDELWKSDGTASGTVRVKDILPGSGSSVGSYFLGNIFTDANGILFFPANDGTHGRELWRTDGTENGTTMVKDIRPGSDGSYPIRFSNVNGQLLFVANDGTHGRELWKTDGTTAGTLLVKDISTGSGHGVGGYGRSVDFQTVNGNLFFTDDSETLWKSDGTNAGTVRVKNIRVGGNTFGDSMQNVNGTLYFIGHNSSSGYELWKSNGTDAGTVLVRDINPGPNDSAPGDMTNFNGTLYFNADDGTRNNELWSSDGTTAGTQIVADINPGRGFGFPQNLTVLGDVLYFTANDGIAGHELWRVGGDSNPSLSVCGVAANKIEGNTGLTPFTFKVERFGGLSGSHTVNFTVAGNTANPASAADFGGSFPSGQVTFAPNETSKIVTINVAGDLLGEANEGFVVKLSNPSGGAVIKTGLANGVIRNDETGLSIVANSASKSEGNAGATPFTFTVMRGGNLTAAVTANFSVTGSGASPASATDFVGNVLPSGTVAFAANETSKLITINVKGDTVVESNEGFTVTLSNISGGSSISVATAAGLIRNDEVLPPTLSITATSADKAEGNSGSKPYTFTVTRSGNTSAATTVNYAVTGVGANPTATSDFIGNVFPSGSVTFAAGQTSRVITIPVRGDTAVEQNETFRVTLSNPTGGATITTPAATGVIRNNDTSLAIAATSANKNEGNTGTTTLFTFTVTRSGLLTGTTTVDYAVTGNGANRASASDFLNGVFPTGTVTFTAGQTTKVITIRVRGDQTVEQNEGFRVTLLNPSLGALITSPLATGLIRNDDV